MARIWIIPAGAGVLSALLFLAVAVGSPGALILGYLAPLPLFAMGLGAGMLMNAPFSSMAHASYNAQRAELIAAMQSGGLKAFLEARDGGFRPEPFGPRSAQKT